MNRVGVVISGALIVVFALSGAGMGGTLSSKAVPALRSQGPDAVPDEILVKLKPGIAAAAVARAVGAQIQRRLGKLGVLVLRVPPGTREGTLRVLQSNPLVEFAEPNGYVHAFVVPNDPYVAGCYWTSSGQCLNQWAWATVHAYEAWDITKGSSAVRVAVIDTGIDVGDPNYLIWPDAGHADLDCQRIIMASFVPGESGNDDNGHGTHVAGTIGACTNNGVGVAGANWHVQLMGAKVLDYSGSGTIDAVASGIQWAADNGANVINLSLGTSVPSATLQLAVDYAWNKGAVLVCSAGNDGTTAPNYPAAYPNCIAVAATDRTDAKAWFSTYGSWVSVAAPGVDIVSTIQDDWFWCYLCYAYGYYLEYDALSGTSMAAPHVAGLAALVWARGGCTTNACVRNKIESTAEQIPGTGTYWQWGRVNYYNALR